MKKAVAIKVVCSNCDFKYPPLLFPKFAEIPHLLWKELYRISKDFKAKEFYL